jgi:superfamily II DNA helicase RecQ
MRFHFFTVEALAPTAGEAELNAFCAQHRIASVDKQFVAHGAHGYWLFYLTTVEGDGSERAPGGGKRGRVDYREVLSETDFAVFADLRDLRKTMAEQEDVPMYALSTNEQLAEMVTRRATTIAALGEIDGVGKARIEKHGKYFVALLGKAFTELPASAETLPGRGAREQ